ncbi:MAG: hypothetical protein Q8L48_07245 [Archangium sp.]|nr:hypothetical protein [Archangium sp.]
MNHERDAALGRFAELGFTGVEVYLAELIPAIEMAWADGEVQANERALLEAYCEALVNELNRQAGARLFSVGRARKHLQHLLRRRLTPPERGAALWALRVWSKGPSGHLMRQRIVEWSEAVAAVDGSPVWDTRELFWLQSVKRTLDVV